MENTINQSIEDFLIKIDEIKSGLNELILKYSDQIAPIPDYKRRGTQISLDEIILVNNYFLTLESYDDANIVYNKLFDHNIHTEQVEKSFYIWNQFLKIFLEGF